MKKLQNVKIAICTMFIMVLTAGAFTACKKDKGGSVDIKTSNLVGKWHYVTFFDNGVEHRNEFDSDYYILLNADGTAYDSDDDDYGTWKLSGSAIVFTNRFGRSASAQIAKLTTKELVLSTKDGTDELVIHYKR